MVESGDLVDLGLGELDFLGQCGQMLGRQLAKPIVDSMEVLDQQVTPRRLVAQHRTNVGERRGLDMPAIRGLTFGLSGGPSTAIGMSSLFTSKNSRVAGS